MTTYEDFLAMPVEDGYRNGYTSTNTKLWIPWFYGGKTSKTDDSPQRWMNGLKKGIAFICRQTGGMVTASISTDPWILYRQVKQSIENSTNSMMPKL